MPNNFGPNEFVIWAVIVGLLVLWVVGIVKLFQKNEKALAWVAIAGIIAPFIAVVGCAGWFVGPRID